MRRLLLALLLILAGLEPVYSAESDFTVVGGLDFGFKTLDLDTGTDPGSSGGGGGGTLKSSFITINPNFGIAYKSFYAAVSFDKSIHATPDIATEGNGTSARVLEYTRSESTYTLGYRLTPSFSVFGGYTTGANEFTESSTNGGNLRVKEITYDEAGPFLGVAYNVTREKGTLGLSLGYAKLDSTLKFVNNPGGVDVAQGTKGDNTGLSYGLTWSGPLTGSLNYRIGAKSTRYEMQGSRGIVEKYMSIFLGISNYF